MTPPSKDQEGVLQYRMEQLETKIEQLEDKIDQILAKLNGLNCPVHNLKIDTFEKRLDKLEDQKAKPAVDTKFISDVAGIIVKAVVATAAAIFGFKQF